MAITADDLQAMVSHWLGCPPNGYLGSGYGAPLYDLLQAPLSGPEADALIAKLREDIAVMAELPAETIAVTVDLKAPDRLELFVEVAGQRVPIDLGLSTST